MTELAMAAEKYVPLGVPVKAVQLTAETAKDVGRGKEGDWIIEDDGIFFLLEDEYFSKRFLRAMSLRLVVVVSEPEADVLVVTASALSGHVDQTPYIEAAFESLQSMLTRDDGTEAGLAH